MLLVEFIRENFQEDFSRALDFVTSNNEHRNDMLEKI